MNNDDMSEFLAAANGVLDFCVLPRCDADACCEAANNGDRDAQIIAGSAMRWFDNVASGESTCIGCETVFDVEALPGAFAIVVPFTNTDRTLVAGICEACCERDGPHEVAERFWNTIWPRCTPAEAGHA